MKVAILKRDLRPVGGLEKQTHYIKKAFEERGAQVTVVAQKTPSSHFSYRKIEEYDEYCHTFLRQHPHEIVLGLDRNRFQTHLRAGNGVHAAYLDLRKKSENFIKGISFSLNPLHRTILKIEKEGFEHPELRALIVNSQMVQEQVLEYYHVDPKKIYVLHNGVEWEESGEEFQRDSDRFEFLFVGHNFQRKGLHKLLEALACLSRTDFHLSVVGEDKNMGQFQALAKKNGLNVSFFGKQPHLGSFYRKADALVIPSFYDPFANVTVEALAMGVFVVSSKTNGGCEVLTPETGIVIESLHRKESFIAALEEAMRRPKTKESHGKIRQSVRHLDFSVQMKKMCDLCLT